MFPAPPMPCDLLRSLAALVRVVSGLDISSCSTRVLALPNERRLRIVSSLSLRDAAVDAERSGGCGRPCLIIPTALADQLHPSTPNAKWSAVQRQHNMLHLRGEMSNLCPIDRASVPFPERQKPRPGPRMRPTPAVLSRSQEP